MLQRVFKIVCSSLIAFMASGAARGHCSLINTHRHRILNAAFRTQDLLESVCAQNVSQGGLGQQARGAVRIRDVLDGHNGVVDVEVDDGVNENGHAVLGENLSTNGRPHEQKK